MVQTPREIVTRSLKFEHPLRIPRQLWVLPWAATRYPEALKELNQCFSSDIVGTEYRYPPSKRVKGDPYAVGSYTDEWGCVFENVHGGVIGEVRNPTVRDLGDRTVVKPPYEQLPVGEKERQAARDIINRSCAKTDRFVMADICPRPWERYQFLRGTENALCDVALQENGFHTLLKCIHDFYLTELEFWVTTDVDGIMFMDDWGAQAQLLISPKMWKELFKPLYRDYCDLIHSRNKFSFMHSDGYILDIYSELIEVGVDAVNSQLFVMDMEALAEIAKGKITFWGEIDRQHVLSSPDPKVGREAVRKVAKHFYDPAGGLIAQFVFGASVNPETALAVADEWGLITK